jgi:hypothetical protein
VTCLTVRLTGDGRGVNGAGYTASGRTELVPRSPAQPDPEGGPDALKAASTLPRRATELGARQPGEGRGVKLGAVAQT